MGKGKLAGRGVGGEESPEGTIAICLLLPCDSRRDAAVSNTTIYYPLFPTRLVPFPLARPLRRNPQSTLSTCPNQLNVPHFPI